jgi:hypothetical protein
MAEDVELVGERFVSANGDFSQEYRYRGVVFKFINRADPDRSNEVWSQSKELHPAFWFYQKVGKQISEPVAMIFGAEAILDKHEEWERKATL